MYEKYELVNLDTKSVDILRREKLVALIRGKKALVDNITLSKDLRLVTANPDDIVTHEESVTKGIEWSLKQINGITFNKVMSTAKSGKFESEIIEPVKVKITVWANNGRYGGEMIGCGDIAFRWSREYNSYGPIVLAIKNFVNHTKIMVADIRSRADRLLELNRYMHKINELNKADELYEKAVFNDLLKLGELYNVDVKTRLKEIVTSNERQDTLLSSSIKNKFRYWIAKGDACDIDLNKLRTKDGFKEYLRYALYYMAINNDLGSMGNGSTLQYFINCNYLAIKSF